MLARLFKKNEYEELLKQREADVAQQQQQQRQPRGKLDIRRIQLFGDSYSEAAYDLANQIYPNRRDTAVKCIEKMDKLARQWQPRKEIFFHYYGPHILTGLSCLTSLYITSHFRRFLRLDRYARYIMYSSSVAFPCMAIAFYNLIKANLTIPLNGLTCTTCVAVKSAAFQSVVAVVFPSFFTVLLGFYYAHVYHTVPSVPSSFLYKKAEARHVGRLVQAIAERSHFSRILFSLFLVNLFAGYYVAEKEQEDAIFMYKKVLDQQERVVRANRGAGVVDADVATLSSRE